MYCLKCGRQYADTGTFCPYCGHKPEKTASDTRTKPAKARRRLKTARSHTIMGSPGMFKQHEGAGETGESEDAATTALNDRRPSITDTAPSEQKNPKRRFHNRPRSVAPTRTFIRAKSDIPQEDIPLEAPRREPSPLITASLPQAPIVSAHPPPTVPTATVPNPSMAPPPLPESDPSTALPASRPVSASQPPELGLGSSAPSDSSEPGIELPANPGQPNPILSMARSSTALDTSDTHNMVALSEPEKTQRPPEEKSIEVDAESGLLLPSLHALLGLDDHELMDDGEDVIDIDAAPSSFEVEADTSTEPTPPSQDFDPNTTYAQGSNLEDPNSESAGGEEADAQEAALHASWEKDFDFNSEDSLTEEEDGVMLLGGGGAIRKEELNSTTIEDVTDEDDSFDDYVELTDDDDGEISAKIEAGEGEGDEAGEDPKKLSSKKLAAGVVFLTGVAAAVYMLFFAGPGFDTATVKLGSKYIPESSDLVVGVDYTKLRTSRLYAKLKSPLEGAIQTVRLIHKKGIISPVDVTFAAVGIQGEGDGFKHVLALQGQFEAGTVEKGLVETFSWQQRSRSRQISNSTFHGSPYEVGLADTNELLFVSHRSLTEQAMHVKAAGAANFLKRENFERALKMVQTDATLWAVVTVTPWLLRELSEWLLVPTNMIGTGDIVAISIDTTEGLTLHLAAIFGDEEHVVMIEDFVNTLEDRLNPIISSDDFDKKDKGALMEVVKSRRFKREEDSLQFSIKASDAVLDEYFEPLYALVMGMLEDYHKTMRPVEPFDSF
jgi:uncharacterized Zn finger protein (UPF0148 family)